MYHATQPQIATKKLLVQERGWFYVVFIIFVNVIRDHFLIYLLLTTIKTSSLPEACRDA
ncbi:hypothetical protein NC652_004749 [Populus alba x Populus x berolinensis]|uniref:Uncharacterized protein n=1 Tax=Populus alba x Populus x berolinensis TaxID=444605 RepID=A0AAD6WKM9_9ROSI|nr:hypothetical protein NC652_004557 [Populus alba x Populus x berolinensis]KAJ6967287.1 hypothetical protein NC652_004749 [Populus alba x Populus x berolinensis]KAJ7015246.1 hypothetical protein NC653_004526 [Populus alba x Populus x berolinensis]KAJ7015516.1 hypothetical protein NC653_004729 [Populus alba x Populus x berolinensis]